MPYLIFRYHKVEVPIPLAYELELTIGRSRKAHIKIGDSQLSRQHLKFAYRNGVLTVSDLGSRNGTYLNRQKIKSRDLDFNDKVNAGKATFTYRETLDEVPADWENHFTVFAECPHCQNAFHPDDYRFGEEIKCKFCTRPFMIQNVRPVLKCQCGKFYNARKVSAGVNFKCPNCQAVYALPGDMDPTIAVKKYVGDHAEPELEPEPEPPGAGDRDPSDEGVVKTIDEKPSAFQEAEAEKEAPGTHPTPAPPSGPREKSPAETHGDDEKLELDRPAEEPEEDFEADLVFEGEGEKRQPGDVDLDELGSGAALTEKDLEALHVNSRRSTVASDRRESAAEKPDTVRPFEKNGGDKDDTTDFQLL